MNCSIKINLQKIKNIYIYLFMSNPDYNLLAADVEKLYQDFQ
jgi:hypothetical protein